MAIKLLLVLSVIFVASLCDTISIQGYKKKFRPENMPPLEILELNVTIEALTDIKKVVADRRDIDLIAIDDEIVTVLPQGSLDGVTIDEFRMNHNQLEDLQPGAFQGASFNHLKLINNQITILKKGVLNDRTLRVVHLSNNLISDIEDGALAGFNASRLLLSNNKLTELRAAMFVKSSISGLFLYDNSISKIEEGTFQNIDQLYHLDLSNNKIEHFGTVFTNLLHIDNIDLSNNLIKTLSPGSFTGSTMRYIHLVNNGLTEIGKGIFDNLPLYVLQLSNNSISKIERGAFAQTHRDFTVKLSGNKLGNLNSGSLGGFDTSVEYVDVDDNDVSSIEQGAFNNLKALGLDLSDNHIKKIKKGTFKGTRIYHLMLNDNEITEIEEGALAEVEKLNYIDLTGNKLEGINLEDTKIFPAGIQVSVGESRKKWKYAEYPNIGFGK